MITMTLIKGLLVVLYLIGIWYCAGVYDRSDEDVKDSLFTVIFWVVMLLWPVFVIPFTLAVWWKLKGKA